MAAFGCDDTEVHRHSGRSAADFCRFEAKQDSKILLRIAGSDGGKFFRAGDSGGSHVRPASELGGIQQPNDGGGCVRGKVGI